MGAPARSRTLALTAAAALGGAGLLLTGCSAPGQIDGDLTDAWAGLPEPVGFVPDAGVCHPQAYQETAQMLDYTPVDCDRPHQTETVHVGEFTGETAQRDAPPEPGSAGWQEAFRQCEEAAVGYLGADFRHGPLWLGVTVPSELAWQGGARWLRCEVTELETREREGSLAGALADSSELTLGCVVVAVDDSGELVESMDPVACTEPHDAEFVGVWHSTEETYPGPDDDDAWLQIHGGCLGLVAEYTDVPDDADLPFRTGTVAVPMEPADWDNGDRGFRCYLWLDGQEVEESLAGAGPDALPIQTE